MIGGRLVFWLTGDLRTRVFRVVRFTTNLPEVRFHGLFAGRGVFLSQEGSLIARHVLQAVGAGVDGGLDSDETFTDRDLLRGDGGRTGHGTQTAEIEAGAGSFRLGRGYTVGSEHHLLVCCVRGLLVDLGQRTADRLDCICIFYFCHGMFGVCRTDRFADRVQTVALTEHRPIYRQRICLVRFSTPWEGLRVRLIGILVFWLTG